MATRNAKIDQKADLIWAIADKLTGVYKPHEYGEVILPLTVIRRFDCILAKTKDAVLAKNEEVKNLPMKDILLRKASGYEFYNTSKFTFERLVADPENIEANFRNYLEGFSANVRDIIVKFKFDGHITTMANKDILYIVLKEFTTERANLHPDEISNLEMGYIFEEIIRRFSEAHNEDAGQHYTPREVIQLMVNILFYDDNDILSGKNVAKTIYDPACGTGGMLSVAEEYLHSLNASAELVPFGQEINDQTFAICKADMLIKGNNAEFIKDGNTLSDDQFKGQHFDYIISNPPFGREWKNEKVKVEEEAKLGFGGRFGAGLPSCSDGQMLFLMTAISKMKEMSQGGSRVAIIHNGSPLTSGEAESGPASIRKYILDNDLLEAIIALPVDLFYNTNLATFIWILSNKKKGTKREGIVQLIDASRFFEKRRKALGKKKNNITEKQIAEITSIYAEMEENNVSKLFTNDSFAYNRVIVEYPLYNSDGTIRKEKGKMVSDNERKATIKLPLGVEIDSYFAADILPFDPDAWYDKKKIKNGYEIPFTRLFYAPDDTKTTIVANERRQGLLDSTIDILNKIAYDSFILTHGVDRNVDVCDEDCPVDWVKGIPKHWEIIKSKNVFRLRNEKGNEVEQLLAATQKHGMCPQEEIEGVVQVKEETDLQTFKTVHKYDYVISLRSFQGGFEMSDYEGVCSPAYQVFYSIRKINPIYFKMLFKSTAFIDKINSLTIGIRDGKNILFQDFGEVYLAIPPIEEQNIIVQEIERRIATARMVFEQEVKKFLDNTLSFK